MAATTTQQDDWEITVRDDRKLLAWPAKDTTEHTEGAFIAGIIKTVKKLPVENFYTKKQEVNDRGEPQWKFMVLFEKDPNTPDRDEKTGELTPLRAIFMKQFSASGKNMKDAALRAGAQRSVLEVLKPGAYLYVSIAELIKHPVGIQVVLNFEFDQAPAGAFTSTDSGQAAHAATAAPVQATASATAPVATPPAQGPRPSEEKITSLLSISSPAAVAAALSAEYPDVPAAELSAEVERIAAAAQGIPF